MPAEFFYLGDASEVVDEFLVPSLRPASPPPSAFVEQIKNDDINSKYGKSDYPVKDFGAITERVYFDYQQSKIYIRTNN